MIISHNYVLITSLQLQECQNKKQEKGQNYEIKSHGSGIINFSSHRLTSKARGECDEI